jgi:membrane-bound ClpP family serine protease
LWEAKSDGAIKTGEEVIIIGIERLVVEVKKKEGK